MKNRIEISDGVDYIFFAAEPKEKRLPLKLIFRDHEKQVYFTIDYNEIQNNTLMQLLKVIEFKAKRAQEQLANLACSSAASSKGKET